MGSRPAITLFRPRQCSSATSWWKFPSVAFKVSSKDRRGFCGGRKVAILLPYSSGILSLSPAYPFRPCPQPVNHPFPCAPPTLHGHAHMPTPSRRPRPFPGKPGVSGPAPTCAEGNWGTASRSRPCSWEWMLARARWDRVSLCRKTGREEDPVVHAPSPLLPGDTEPLRPGPSPTLLHPVPLPTALTC